jgi:hypothetical protein
VSQSPSDGRLSSLLRRVNGCLPTLLFHYCLTFTLFILLVVCNRWEAERRIRGRFKDSVGPIGAFIKVVQGKEDFAKIAESPVAGHLIVSCLSNPRLVESSQSIRTRAGCRQDCGLFGFTNSPRFKVPPPPVDGIETVAGVLSIPNDIVFGVSSMILVSIAESLARTNNLVSRSFSREGLAGARCLESSKVYCMPNGDKLDCQRYWICGRYLERPGSAAFHPENRTAAIAEVSCAVSTGAQSANHGGQARRKSHQIPAAVESSKTLCCNETPLCLGSFQG